MTAERIVRIVAGFFILLSLPLGVEASPLFVSKHFIWFTGFVWLDFFQERFPQFLPAPKHPVKFGIKGGSCERAS